MQQNPQPYWRPVDVAEGPPHTPPKFETAVGEFSDPAAQRARAEAQLRALTAGQEESLWFSQEGMWVGRGQLQNRLWRTGLGVLGIGVVMLGVLFYGMLQGMGPSLMLVFSTVAGALLTALGVINILLSRQRVLLDPTHRTIWTQAGQKRQVHATFEQIQRLDQYTLLGEKGRESTTVYALLKDGRKVFITNYDPLQKGPEWGGEFRAALAQWMGLPPAYAQGETEETAEALGEGTGEQNNE